MRIPQHIRILIVLLAVTAPVHALTQVPQAAVIEPYQQEFVLTAYYSPLPKQCCYVLGGERADKVMNGEGIAGADETPVYPGMLAAPASYPFGTRIVLPGLGVMTVHDRGGAIVEQENGTHRLDVWAGFGEEGLARALAFGVQRIKGTVYLPGGFQPEERFTFDALPAPVDRLQQYVVTDSGLLDVAPKKGDKGLSVVMLRDTLRAAGYRVDPGDLFDDELEAVLRQFLADMRLAEPSDRLTETAAAHVLAAKVHSGEPDLRYLNPESSAADIQRAQRLLRFLGYYSGRTDGIYDQNVAEAILAFQKRAELVGSATDPGAGRIGPLTKAALTRVWRRSIVAEKARNFLLYKRVASTLAQRGELPDRFLEYGHKGEDVRLLQELLAERGFFPAEKINGVFGDLTQASLIRYQLSRKLIASSKDPAAGLVGPATLRSLRDEELKEAYGLVRGKGWGVL